MSEVFEGYEQQYREISTVLSRKCAAASAIDGEKKKRKLSEIQADVQESESLIRKMDLEARSLQPTVRAGLLSGAPRLRRVRYTRDSASAAPSDQREKLMRTSERLNQSSDRIKESHGTVLETEEIGVSILQNLHNQRQKLLHAHTTLHGVDDSIGKSNKILASMSKWNKWFA